MKKVIQDKELIKFLLVAVLLGLGLQIIFYFSQQQMWLLAAMWTPTLAVLALGKTGISVLKELRKFPLKWVAYAVLLGILPHLLSQILYGLFDLGAWNPSFVLAHDGSSTLSIVKGDFVLGNGQQSYAFFTLNIIVSILLASIFTTLLGAVGEEIGWRGFLQPRLESHVSIFVATLFVALIWSYWHVPANLGGANGKEILLLNTFFIFPLGVLFMTFVFSWLRLKSNAIWPCAILHGVNNTVASVHLLKPNSETVEAWITLFSYIAVGSFFVFAVKKISDSKKYG